MAVSIRENCTGCGACVAACRCNALTLATERPQGYGKKRAVVDDTLCCGCAACIRQCRFQALTLNPEMK